MSIRIIQPAHQLVGGENLTGDICQPALHVGRLCGFASYVENQVKSGLVVIGRQGTSSRAAKVARGGVTGLGIVSGLDVF